MTPPIRVAILRRETYSELRISMNEIFFVVEEEPEGGYSARALGESIFTEADTVEELYENVRESVRCHFEENSVPKAISLHFVRDEIIAA